MVFQQLVRIDVEDINLLPIAAGVRSRVEMLGRVDDDRLASYLKAAEVYIGPATGGESFGIVLAEAMAAGKPIVASDIDG